MTLLPPRVRRIAGRIRDRLGPRAAILLYHRVSDSLSDPYLLRVRTRNFVAQMDVLARRGCVVPLRELAARHRESKLPHGAVAITFDDGYVDNLRVAKPILERHGLPATVFMTAGGSGREREFWWDELERVVLGTAELPAMLDAAEIFDDDGMQNSWLGRPAQVKRGGEPPLGRGAQATNGLQRTRWTLESSSPEAFRYVAWDVTQPTDPTPRHALLRDVHTVIRTMPHEPRQAVLDRLRAWAGAAEGVRPEFRAMSPDEMRELVRDGLVEVGAHTLTHPSLPALSAEVRRKETAGSRDRLQEILGAPVTSFAYPYGDVDDATVSAVADAGFDTACACDGRITVPRSHPLRLPRLDVLDWDGDTFAQHLERWLRA